MQEKIEVYEKALAMHRTEFTGRLNLLFEELHDPRVAALTIIHYCALGVGMTRDVPTWIHGAAAACVAKGYDKLGQALATHADHEEGHHKMMEEDVRSLINWWNRRWSRTLIAANFQNQEPDSVKAYQSLHLDVIYSEAPYRQLAIEYEIERLSVNEGPRLFRQLTRRLDTQVLQCLSFLKDHVLLDVGHTRYNRRLLADFLKRHPEALDGMIASGQQALRIYGDFVADCVKYGLASMNQLDLKSAKRKKRPLLLVAREKLSSAAWIVRMIIASRRAEASGESATTP